MNVNVQCSKSGTCQRFDGIELTPGFQPIRKIVVKPDSSIFDMKDIYSIDPFANSKQLQFLPGSRSYVCADGFDDCIDSCCKMGLCTAPKNMCLQYKDLSDRMIYIPIIFFAVLTAIYWFLFIKAGIKYNNKKNTVMVVKNNDEHNSNQHGGLNNFDNEDIDSHKKWKGIGTIGNQNYEPIDPIKIPIENIDPNEVVIEKLDKLGPNTNSFYNSTKGPDRKMLEVGVFK